jgi:4'-phosphopantetheinyl transferase
MRTPLESTGTAALNLGVRAGVTTSRFTALPLRADDVDIWRAALDEQPDDVVRFLQTLLSVDERQRADAFFFERDRRRFVVGRGILRMLVARYVGGRPETVAFCYGPHGKPALRDGGGLYFNVAHSEGLALYAFTRVGEVGIDVECMRDLPDWEQIAESAFSPHELAQLRACPPEQRRDEFFRAWARQEAVLKALGTGLGAVAETGAESGFIVYPLDAGAGFAAALACSPAARKPQQVLGWSREASANVASASKTSRSFQTNFL